MLSAVVAEGEDAAGFSHKILENHQLIRLNPGEACARTSLVELHPTSADLSTNQAVTIKTRDRHNNLAEARDCKVLCVGAVEIVSKRLVSKYELMVNVRLLDPKRNIERTFHAYLQEEEISNGGPISFQVRGMDLNIPPARAKTEQGCDARRECRYLRICPTPPPFPFEFGSAPSDCKILGSLSGVDNNKALRAASPWDQSAAQMQEYWDHIKVCPFAQLPKIGGGAIEDEGHAPGEPNVLLVEKEKRRIRLALQEELEKADSCVAETLKSWEHVSTRFRAASQQLVLGVFKDLPIDFELRGNPLEDAKSIAKRKDTINEVLKHQKVRLQAVNKKTAMYHESRKLLMQKLGGEMRRRLELNTDAYRLLARHDHVIRHVNRRSSMKWRSRDLLLAKLKSTKRLRSAQTRAAVAQSVVRDMSRLNAGLNPRQLDSYKTLVDHDQGRAELKHTFESTYNVKEAANSIAERMRLKLTHRTNQYNNPIPDTDSLAYDLMVGGFWRNDDPVDPYGVKKKDDVPVTSENYGERSEALTKFTGLHPLPTGHLGRKGLEKPVMAYDPKTRSFPNIKQIIQDRKLQDAKKVDDRERAKEMAAAKEKELRQQEAHRKMVDDARKKKEMEEEIIRLQRLDERYKPLPGQTKPLRLPKQWIVPDRPPPQPKRYIRVIKPEESAWPPLDDTEEEGEDSDGEPETPRSPPTLSDPKAFKKS